MHGLEFKQIKAACCCNSSNMSQNYTNKSAKLKMQSICTSLLSKTNSPVSLSWLQGYTPPRDAADICLALCLANDVPNSNLDTSYPDIWFHFYISHNQGSFAIYSLLVMLWTLKSTWLSSKALSKWFIPQPKNSMSPSTSRPQPAQCPWCNCLRSFWRSLWCLIYIDTVHF